MYKENNISVFDMHCDLLSYLAKVSGADPEKKEEIGCALPHLKEGNVKLQVAAIYTDVVPGSTSLALKQSQIFQQLLRNYPTQCKSAVSKEEIAGLPYSERAGLLVAIENASGFCEEEEPLDAGFAKLERLVENVGKILYISLTHHGENRFGGGNYSKVGLKEDGKRLLDYLSGKKIAVDLAHTSDALALGILDYTAKNNLDVPIIASHSNFRSVFSHVRNLNDEIALEVIQRKGLIGINFLRAYVHQDDPEKLFEHILYGLEMGAEEALCFGADYFYVLDHPVKSRLPFYFKAHEHAGKYQQIVRQLRQHIKSEATVKNICHQNIINFIYRSW